MGLEGVLMGILICPLLTAGRSLACCCSCPADCRLLLSVSEADEKECIAYVYTPRIKCCSVKEEEIVYDCTAEVPLCKRDFVPPGGECPACLLETARKSRKRRKCDVWDSCCASRVAELNCNICHDLEKCCGVLEKVFPCGLKCVSKECCLLLQDGSHADAKACPPCCVCVHMHALGPNCTDRFCCDTAPNRMGCGVLGPCCASNVTELNCKISLDLKKCFTGFEKVLPCVLTCVRKERCLCTDSGSHVYAKACLPCCLCEQKHMDELVPNYTDRLPYETAPPNRDIRTKENLQAILASLGLVLLLL